jgi:hypothetical protein
MAQASIPTSRRRSFLPCLTRIEPRRRSRSVSVTESASLIRRSARQSTTINALMRSAIAIVASLAHDGHDLVDGRWGRRVPLALVAPSDPGAEAGCGRRRATAPGSVKQRLDRRHDSLPESWTITRPAVPFTHCRSPRGCLTNQRCCDALTTGSSGVTAQEGAWPRNVPWEAVSRPASRRHPLSVGWLGNEL